MLKNNLKTRENSKNVINFIKLVKDEEKRTDSLKLLKIFEQITGKRARMWGESLIGFGSYHYKSLSGQEGDWPLTAFSPRKQSLSIYIMPGFKNYSALMKKIGPHKTGSSCLYLKNLSGIHLLTLKTLIAKSYKDMQSRWIKS